MNNEEKILEALADIRKAAILQAKNVLTTEECAMLTGYSEDTIRNMASKRSIPHYKRQGRLFFNKRIIEEWIEKNYIPTKDDLEVEANKYVFTHQIVMKNGNKETRIG